MSGDPRVGSVLATADAEIAALRGRAEAAERELGRCEHGVAHCTGPHLSEECGTPETHLGFALETTEAEVAALVDGVPPFLAAGYLKDFISEDLLESTTPIVYRTRKGGRRTATRLSCSPRSARRRKRPGRVLMLRFPAPLV